MDGLQVVAFASAAPGERLDVVDVDLAVEVAVCGSHRRQRLGALGTDAALGFVEFGQVVDRLALIEVGGRGQQPDQGREPLPDALDLGAAGEVLFGVREPGDVGCEIVDPASALVCEPDQRPRIQASSSELGASAPPSPFAGGGAGVSVVAWASTWLRAATRDPENPASTRAFALR